MTKIKRGVSKINKTERYFKEIQKIAINNQGNIKKYLKEIEEFKASQNILKRGKLKSEVEFITVYFIEYINTRFKRDFLNKKEGQDIYVFLTYVISKEVMPLKSICVDEVVRKVILNKAEDINSVIVNNYSIKKNRILAMKEEIFKLQKEMI